MKTMTPEERAAALTAGLHGLQLKYTWTGPLSLHPMAPAMNVAGDGVMLLRDAIAAAIREAVAAERERCAKLAEYITLPDGSEHLAWIRCGDRIAKLIRGEV